MQWPASSPTIISRAPQTPVAPEPSATPDPPTNSLQYLQHGPGSSSLARGDAAASSSLPRRASREFLGSATGRCSGDWCVQCRFLSDLQICHCLEVAVAHPVLTLLWVVLNLLCSCLVVRWCNYSFWKWHSWLKAFIGEAVKWCNAETRHL